MAAAHGNTQGAVSQEATMSFLISLQSEPWRFDYFAVLRQLERSYADRPRIGNSAARRDDYVQLGQDPYMDFPASNLARVEATEGKPLKVFVKFLGLLGPQGALPLATTEETYHYFLAQDDAFPRFLDIFNNRFIQLFFRAWADSRPIAQHDRPDLDRFIAYIGSTVGIGSAPYLNLDSIPDAAKLQFAGLLGAQAKCASRLAGAISGLFHVQVEIDEFIGSRIALEPADWTSIGRTSSRLGEDALLGQNIFSVQDKIRVRIYTKDLAQYTRFLPGGDLCVPLADLVFFYNGEQLEWDVELAIPAGAAAPIRIGAFGQLGWTSWLAPNWTSLEPYRRDARFHPAERVRQERAAAQTKD
jgi:type VI secretion system protein ImpH